VNPLCRRNSASSRESHISIIIDKTGNLRGNELSSTESRSLLQEHLETENRLTEKTPEVKKRDGAQEESRKKRQG